jgi:SAM-dependent methyltransferase
MEGRSHPGPASYSLTLSEQELVRYRIMAAGAADNKAAEWLAAGVVPGARVADVGCGPGAVLRILAERVGAAGQAVGVDADPAAVAIARQQVAGLPQGRAEVGQADATGLEPGGYDVVMCLPAHNGGREAAIVAHLACRAPVIRVPPGMRPPSWAARAEMAAAGLATDADIDRWERAFARLDAAERRPWLFPASFVAIGQRP